MRKLSLKQLNGEDLISGFSQAAAKLGNAINLWESGVRETNQLFAIRDEIRSRELQAQLMPLLDDKNRFVRYYAAQQLLAVAPARSRQIIEQTAQQRDAVAGDAGMFLYLLDNGFSQS